MGIENDYNCSCCKKERDTSVYLALRADDQVRRFINIHLHYITINHLFWRCACVQQFWKQFQTAINDGLATNDGCSKAVSVLLNENTILFGHDSNFKSDDNLDLIFSSAKVFVYKCKINRHIPQLYQFYRYLKTTFEAEKFIQKLSMSHDKLVMDRHFYKMLVEI